VEKDFAKLISSSLSLQVIDCSLPMETKQAFSHDHKSIFNTLLDWQTPYERLLAKTSAAVSPT
ncbi:MAG: hypothetical protein ACRETY_12420, partial [Steroidobacteraceae bacterium]